MRAKIASGGIPWHWDRRSECNVVEDVVGWVLYSLWVVEGFNNPQGCVLFVLYTTGVTVNPFKATLPLQLLSP